MMCNVRLTPEQIAITSLLLDRLSILEDPEFPERHLDEMRKLWDEAYKDANKLAYGLGRVSVAFK